MMHITAVVAILSLGLLASSQTNLPDVPTGVFNASTRIEIKASLDAVWDAILDFPSYPDWNPFARSQVVTDALGIPLASQTPEVGLHLLIQAQIPPLPQPVNATTPPNPLHAQTSFEIITAVDATLHRAAWKQVMLPEIVLSAERWSAVSVVQTSEGERTLYESREVYAGPVALAVQALFATSLQESFDAQGVALKELLEDSAN